MCLIFPSDVIIMEYFIADANFTFTNREHETMFHQCTEVDRCQLPTSVDFYLDLLNNDCTRQRLTGLNDRNMIQTSLQICMDPGCFCVDFFEVNQLS